MENPDNFVVRHQALVAYDIVNTAPRNSLGINAVHLSKSYIQLPKGTKVAKWLPVPSVWFVPTPKKGEFYIVIPVQIYEAPKSNQ